MRECSYVSIRTAQDGRFIVEGLGSQIRLALNDIDELCEAIRDIYAEPVVLVFTDPPPGEAPAEEEQDAGEERVAEQEPGEEGQEPDENEDAE